MRKRKQPTGLTEDLVIAEEANPNEGPELGGKLGKPTQDPKVIPQIGSKKLDYMLPVRGDLKNGEKHGIPRYDYDYNYNKPKFQFHCQKLVNYKTQIHSPFF